jgi:hypothetical protein
MTHRDVSSGEQARSISPIELKAQLRSMLEILAAPSAVQDAWLRKERYPTDELGLQYLDAVPAWIPRLTANHLLDSQAVDALLHVRNVLEKYLRTNQRMWAEDPSLSLAWAEIRSAAALALKCLQDEVRP